MKVRFAALLFFLASLCINGLAQHSFGGECSGTMNPLSEPLRNAIQKNRAGKNYQNCDLTEELCGSSFVFDLDKDDKDEYFVRLSCGATGNCLYGIFRDKPVRLAGTFTAWFFWIADSNSPWPQIVAYEREGGDQGYIATYAFGRGKYRRVSGRTEKYNSDESSFPEKMGMPSCE